MFEQKIKGVTERSRSCFSIWKEDSKASSVWLHAGRVNGLQRHLQGSQYHLQFVRSLRITFFLVLSIVLIGKFNVFLARTHDFFFFMVKY